MSKSINHLKFCILYSSVDGQTKKICEKISLCLEKQDVETNLFAIEDFDGDILKYNTLIIGAGIRYGKHHKNVTTFISKNTSKLDKIQTAFFSVNLVARKEAKSSPNSNPYMIKFLKSIQWKPDFTEVFAGKLDYSIYSFRDRIMIKLIMKFTDGPTKTNKPIEYTNCKISINLL